MRHRAPWAFAFLFLLFAGCPIGGLYGAHSPAEPSIPYKTQVKGLWFGDLKNAVSAQSLALSLAKQPPATLRQLEKRVDDDIPAMTGVLKARGYLEAVITREIATNRDPVRVTFRVYKGPLYTISSFRVDYTNTTDRIPQPPRVGVKSQGAAARDNVDAAEMAALRYLQEHGYPRPKKAGATITRDDVRKKVKVVCVVDPGAKASFGEVKMAGNENVKVKYLRRRIPWSQGDQYDVEKVEELEKDLLEKGLFRTVRVTATNSQDTAGQLPVTVNVVERPFRTVRAGLSYYSDEGLGGASSWEHRNLFGGAEALSFTISASQIKYGAKGRYTEPDFTARNTDLHVEVDAAHESPDAYESSHAKSTLFLEKRMAHGLTVTAGTAYEHDIVEQMDEVDKYDLISVPLSVESDQRDNELDPAKGTALRLATTPYQDIFSELSFLKSQVEGSVFLRLARSPQLVLATRAMLGSISGEAVDDVPADKRFYAGGGGTVRGYKYQSIGELEDGEAVGGNSMATVSSELRARVTRTLGVAAFVDGGTTYPDSQPDADTPFLWAVGAGVRYYLGFAPLRVDIAFPLNKREDIDANFQIYVSLGQSF